MSTIQEMFWKTRAVALILFLALSIIWQGFIFVGLLLIALSFVKRGNYLMWFLVKVGIVKSRKHVGTRPPKPPKN